MLNYFNPFVAGNTPLYHLSIGYVKDTTIHSIQRKHFFEISKSSDLLENLEDMFLLYC